MTIQEKAAITYGYYNGLTTSPEGWREIYLIAEPGADKKTAFANMVSKWRTKPETRQYFADLQELDAIRKAQEREKGKEEERQRKEGESVRTTSEPKRANVAKVDYNDPNEQKRLLNQIIADSSDDPKTQLDAVKVIQQSQKDKQAARENKIQRFYSPMNCRECPLMEKARKKRV